MAVIYDFDIIHRRDARVDTVLIQVSIVGTFIAFNIIKRLRAGWTKLGGRLGLSRKLCEVEDNAGVRLLVQVLEEIMEQIAVSVF